MTDREDIIRMARDVGFEQNSLGMTYTSGALPELLERFAALVAAAEREACARVADIALLGADKSLSDRVLNAIRSRGQRE